jgi:RNA polymerase sigma-B factor
LRQRRTNPSPAAGQTLDTDEVVRQFMPLVRQIAKRYSRLSPDSFEDLLQVGCMGLLKAIKAYNPEREHKASLRTFALLYIKGEIRHYLRDHSSIVHVPRRLNEISARIVQLTEEMSKELERTPTPAELSERSGYSVAEICEARQSWDTCLRYESLDATDDSEGRDDSPRVFAECVADRKHMDEITYSEEREVLSQALVRLGDRARQIIEFVYFYDLTQKETARLLGLSEMGVSRAVHSGLKRLKEILFTEIL